MCYIITYIIDNITIITYHTSLSCISYTTCTILSHILNITIQMHHMPYVLYIYTQHIEHYHTSYISYAMHYISIIIHNIITYIHFRNPSRSSILLWLESRSKSCELCWDPCSLITSLKTDLFKE